MPEARDVAAVLESIAPLDSGVPNDQLGFIYGDGAREIKGVGCMWNVHSRSIAAAVGQGLDMLICHEAIWMPPQTSPWYDAPPADEIHANRMMSGLLDKHGLVVYRSHSNWDALPVDGVADQAVAALGIEGLTVAASSKFFRVHELPAPVSVRALRDAAARGLGYGPCRIFGNADKSVKRFAFLIGGFGENQHLMPQAARDLGAEALIFGEMSEFIVMSALEMGLPVIETLHSASESPAIRRQAEMLAERLPGLPVRYIPSGAPAFGAE